jgi:hypothetical protein
MRGEQGHCPPAGGPAQVDQPGLQRALVTMPVGGLGDVVDDVEQSRLFVVERRADGQLAGAVGVEAVLDVVEVAGGGERGRGQDDRVLGVPHVLLDQRADVQRRHVQREPLVVAGHFRPVDVFRVGLRHQRVHLRDKFVKQPGGREQRRLQLFAIFNLVL